MSTSKVTADEDAPSHRGLNVWPTFSFSRDQVPIL